MQRWRPDWLKHGKCLACVAHASHFWRIRVWMLPGKCFLVKDIYFPFCLHCIVRKSCIWCQHTSSLANAWIFWMSQKLHESMHNFLFIKTNLFCMFCHTPAQACLASTWWPFINVALPMVPWNERFLRFNEFRGFVAPSAVAYLHITILHTATQTSGKQSFG